MSIKTIIVVAASLVVIVFAARELSRQHASSTKYTSSITNKRWTGRRHAV